MPVGAAGLSAGRVMALDVGTKRVGIAMTDPLGIAVHPGPVLERVPESGFYASLDELIKTSSVEEAVIGAPVGLSGQRGDSYHDAMKVLEECRERWPTVEWNIWDERFTTKMAEEALKHAPRKKRREKGARDRIAAQFILEGYLSARGKT